MVKMVHIYQMDQHCSIFTEMHNFFEIHFKAFVIEYEQFMWIFLMGFDTIEINLAYICFYPFQNKIN